MMSDILGCIDDVIHADKSRLCLLHGYRMMYWSGCADDVRHVNKSMTCLLHGYNICTGVAVQRMAAMCRCIDNVICADKSKSCLLHTYRMMHGSGYVGDVRHVALHAWCYACRQGKTMLACIDKSLDFIVCVKITIIL